MIRQYRKKPVVITAVKFTGRNFDEIKDFCPVADKFHQSDVEYTIGIKTLEGYMEASVGDYVIKGIKGEFYPCKPDIFLASYEEVK